jgi:Domain of unknown function (DUF5655)
MVRWICPRCDREFGRARQGHVCVPGCTVAETFAGRAASFRPIYDAILAHLLTLGPVHEDAVTVGVFLKNDHKLAEVRPRARSLGLALFLPRRVEDERVDRIIATVGGRVVHQLTLRAVEDVDEQLRDWLTEAYLSARDEPDDGRYLASTEGASTAARPASSRAIGTRNGEQDT